jgi:hypothetical protein
MASKRMGPATRAGTIFVVTEFGEPSLRRIDAVIAMLNFVCVIDELKGGREASPIVLRRPVETKGKVNPLMAKRERSA